MVGAPSQEFPAIRFQLQLPTHVATEICPLRYTHSHSNRHKFQDRLVSCPILSTLSPISAGSQARRALKLPLFSGHILLPLLRPVAPAAADDAVAVRL